MTRTDLHLILNSLRQVGPVRVRKMREAFGGIEEIFNQPSNRLASVSGISRAIAESIVDWPKQFNLEEEKEKMRALGVRVVDCEDAAYPERLREIYDPPLVLYYRGDWETVRKRSIAVVGSRHTTSYGFEISKKLSYQCAYAGLSVVSGLARGIDTAAHQGALAAKGKTVAVIGASLDLLYPKENAALAEKIVESGGTVVSEFCMGTPPDKYTFPMRNRIVSGLSEGTLVVEAGEGSGAIITAKMAVDQGRQVFAVPGRIDNPHSKGCHALIKEGAKLVESVDDILSEFEFLFPRSEIQADRRPLFKLSEEEQTIWSAMEDEENHLDELIRKCGLPTAVVSSTLLRLELKRVVKQLPGKYFVKLQ